MGKVLNVGRAEMVDEPECLHLFMRMWMCGTQRFMRCEECGMCTDTHPSEEEALGAANAGRLTRILHPGL